MLILVSLVSKNFNHNTGKLAEYYMFIKIFIHVFWGKMNKCQTIHSLKTWFLFLVVLVAEVTQPSLGVGYEIGRAVALGKVIICLFRPDSGKSKILRTLLKNCHLNFRTLWILWVAGKFYLFTTDLLELNFQNYFKTICIDILRKITILFEPCCIERIFFCRNISNDFGGCWRKILCLQL